MSVQRFETTVEAGERGRVFITIPFNPMEAWGKRQRHYVKGTLNNYPFRGALGVKGGQYFMPLNKELRQGAELSPGNIIAVSMEPDEPEQAAIPEDVLSALEEVPEAKMFFDSLTTFQRNEYIEWIEAAKKAETRASRINEIVSLLKAGKKQR